MPSNHRHLKCVRIGTLPLGYMFLKKHLCKKTESAGCMEFYKHRTKQLSIKFHAIKRNQTPSIIDEICKILKGMLFLENDVTTFTIILHMKICKIRFKINYL